MKRRNFLRTAIFGASTFLVGDEVLDIFNRLIWKKKYFPGTQFSKSVVLSDKEIQRMLRDIYTPMRNSVFKNLSPMNVPNFPPGPSGKVFYLDFKMS